MITQGFYYRKYEEYHLVILYLSEPLDRSLVRIVLTLNMCDTLLYSLYPLSHSFIAMYFLIPCHLYLFCHMYFHVHVYVLICIFIE